MYCNKVFFKVHLSTPRYVKVKYNKETPLSLTHSFSQISLSLFSHFSVQAYLFLVKNILTFFAPGCVPYYIMAMLAYPFYS